VSTTVVHRSEEHDVFIGRPSRWGNPFVIGRDGSRAVVIARYRDWLCSRPELLADLPALRGKRLGCFCAPEPCHGDVLAELADLTFDCPRCGGLADDGCERCSGSGTLRYPSSPSLLPFRP
jgi:hypothetical protein